MLLAAVLVLADEACAHSLMEEGDARLPGGAADDETLVSVEERPAHPPAQLGDPANLEPTRPEVEVAAPARVRRSTVVFRPLFATRERDAERREQQQRRQVQHFRYLKNFKNIENDN